MAEIIEFSKYKKLPPKNKNKRSYTKLEEIIEEAVVIVRQQRYMIKILKNHVRMWQSLTCLMGLLFAMQTIMTLLDSLK